MTTPNPALLSDLASDLLQEEAIAREARASGRAPGPTTGFPGFDEDLGGYLSPGLHVLQAAPGSGKSALALQVSGKCGFPVLYVSSEMRRSELLRRIIARVTNTYLGKLRGGQLEESVLQELIGRAARACPNIALFDATTDQAAPNDIQQAALDVRARFESDGLLIVMDSVTDWAVFTSGGLEEYAATEAALTALKQIASNLACPVLGISHRSREGQKAKGSARLHASKGSGRYEYIAESVWDLDRDCSVEPDAFGRTPAALTLLKSRHGVTGRSQALTFEGRCQEFKEA